MQQVRYNFVLRFRKARARSTALGERQEEIYPIQ